MATVLSYFRIILFIGGTLIGIQVPFYVDQYGKSLESHFLESQRSLNEFQDDANKYFDGSLEALIAHYKQSGDVVFNAGGVSIQAIYSRYLLLNESLAKFKRSDLDGYAQALLKPVADVGAEVKEHYSYAVKLDQAAIMFGLLSGLLLTVAIEVGMRAAVALLASFGRRMQSSP